ncbi:mannitol dehydrogenase family protein [Compostimonas suwonensis]|uniref:Mannitol-1-phosphate 5-dehydrogenase n=1 Tax=Compostimonas suwonensis TaxID=1048394 RepID=A0A2M9BCA4_9MICO|nr:mannitol dehydrogenase family protein [Compostimonas suwonensis]PJJ55578.1 mannitol 2-dehydrogenase [Compostimonas suwonensis]
MAWLSEAEIGRLAIGAADYDRAATSTGIVHFGVGNFHRAHEAMFVDALLRLGEAKDWAICGVGVMPADARMRDALISQNGLYTLVLANGDGSRDARVIGSITEYLYAPDDPQAVVEKLASPQTRIVSLTITEGGYNVDHTTGVFDERTPDVVADLLPGAAPRTVFGLITAGLALRRERGLMPFAIMSCDNIQGNGAVARAAVVAFATAKDESLGRWVGENVAFPNSMVDRITPVTTEDDRSFVFDAYRYHDAWPVVSEPFVQWVLEDDFPAGRPPLELVGVQLVDDVAPYEQMKLRLLNASHQAMAYFGLLAGHRYVDEAASDPLVVALLERYMDEARPTLSPVPGIDLDEYQLTLIERFSNAAIKDTLARLAVDASDRIPAFLLPVVRDNLAAGRPVAVSAAIVASWARYAEGIDEAGASVEVVDPRGSVLGPLARSQRDNPLAFLRNRELFGDLAELQSFSEPYRAALMSLHRVGARKTLQTILG